MFNLKSIKALKTFIDFNYEFFLPLKVFLDCFMLLIKWFKYYIC